MHLPEDGYRSTCPPDAEAVEQSEAEMVSGMTGGSPYYPGDDLSGQVVQNCVCEEYRWPARVMPPRRETDPAQYMTVEEVIRIYDAIAFSNWCGIPLNVFVTINWTSLGVKNEAAAHKRTSNFLNRLLRFQERRGIPPVAVYVHERCKRLGLHVHILTHMPDAIRPHPDQIGIRRHSNLKKIFDAYAQHCVGSSERNALLEGDAAERAVTPLVTDESDDKENKPYKRRWLHIGQFDWLKVGDRYYYRPVDGQFGFGAKDFQWRRFEYLVKSADMDAMMPAKGRGRWPHITVKEAFQLGQFIQKSQPLCGIKRSGVRKCVGVTARREVGWVSPIADGHISNLRELLEEQLNQYRQEVSGAEIAHALGTLGA